ncbi:DUF368 domain-containing protein [Pseudofulvibacter geojedonensis]|uniref:DUF368 domain-containing protein n=1 Tax=Pseudofulvibacter geojedonensis TaxID=1123758 RepID=A0ABW3I072_9FLAO
MHIERNALDKFLLVLKGLAMGAANKVPGVSGGVVAFVAGFYQEFIYSLQRINGTAFKLLFNGRFKAFFKYINGSFLCYLILGMLVSYFSISKVLDYLIIHYELYVWSTFFGLILGSIYSISKKFDQFNLKALLFLIAGVVVGISISFLDPARENDNLLFVFFCGVISVSGMTLPGLSGSFILIIIGNYVLLLVDSVNALYDTFANIFTGDFSFTSDPIRMRMLQVLAVFTLGSLVGMVTFSHLINYLLHKFKLPTISVIAGFIIGSLGVVWPWKETLFKTKPDGSFIFDSNGREIITNYRRFIPELNQETSIAIGFISLGVLIILSLEWYGSKTTKN